MPAYSPYVFRTDGGNRQCISAGGTLEFILSNLDDAKVTAALLMGGGSTTAPLTTAATSKNFGAFFTQTTDATGTDSRGLYWRHYLAGATGSGAAVRPFTTVSAAGANAAHGLDASVSFGASGTLTGEAAAIRGTLQIPNKAIGGTCEAIQAVVSADGASSAHQAAHGAFIRCSLSGESTGVSTINGTLALMSVDGITVGTAGTGNVVDAISGDKAVTHLAKILINNTPYYIMLRNAV